MAAQAAGAQSDCKTIADDKEQLACYDKGTGATAEQDKAASAAPIEKTLDARRAYARQLEKWFLSKGISMDVFTKECRGILSMRIRAGAVGTIHDRLQ